MCIRDRGETHFDRPDHLRHVIAVNTIRSRGIEPPQNAMQMPGPALLRAVAQPASQFFGALRAAEKSFDESAEIETGSAADDGQVSGLLAFAWSCRARNGRNDLAQYLPRLARVFSGSDVSQRIHAIQQVMGNFGALRGGGLGRADFKFPVHGDGIAIYDFSAEAARDRQRQSRLSACRGAEDDHDQRLAVRHLGTPGNFDNLSARNVSARSRECIASSG